jgi:hypothetical protein
MSISGGSYGDWISDYERACDSPHAIGEIACRNCGSRALRLIFVVDNMDAENGTAAFWCDACLRGLIPLRAPIPEGGTTVLRGRESIPNYDLIIDDEDEEE